MKISPVYNKLCIADVKEVISVLLSRIFKLQTTRSSEFMGFRDEVSRNATLESDILVVVIGSGIWPKSKSFKTNVLVLLPKGGKVIAFVQLHLLGKGKSQI